MIVLHTSDWHLGKRLHKMDLKQDHKFFFDWLIQIIAEKEVELLIVAGDIFDTAYPSQESLELYYHFLSRLIQLECKVIVTGGNHDSPSTLNAPSEILKHLDIQVVGGNEPDLNKQLIPLYNVNREVQLVVAAVPFLRDQDLRLEGPEDTIEQRIEQVRNAIIQHYRSLAELSARLYPGKPAIAMGHLFASGVTTSESEREIQVGNLAAIDVADLPDYFRYYAFGHIHKAQWIGEHDYIRYCGSPIALSFTEADYSREVLLLDTEKPFTYKQQVSYVPQAISIPVFRKLARLKGTFQELEEQLQTLEISQLPSFVEIEVTEMGEPNFLVPATKKFIASQNQEKIWIVKHKITNTQLVAGNLLALEHTIDSIKPEEVFRQQIAGIPEEEHEELVELFLQLLNLVQQESNEKIS
jgi:exonuclease SbcD